MSSANLLGTALGFNALSVRSLLIFSTAMLQLLRCTRFRGVMPKVRKVVFDFPQNFPQKRLDLGVLRQTSLECKKP